MSSFAEELHSPKRKFPLSEIARDAAWRIRRPYALQLLLDCGDIGLDERFECRSLHDEQLRRDLKLLLVRRRRPSERAIELVADIVRTLGDRRGRRP